MHLQWLEQSTAEDVRNDPSWREAVFDNPGNHIRNAINTDKIVRLTKRLDVPVLRWKLPLADEFASQLPQDFVNGGYDCSTDS